MSSQHNGLFAVNVLFILCLLTATQSFASQHPSASSVKPAMPQGSRLLPLGAEFFYSRSLGQTNNHKPVIILLSGPNHNFYADSAWFALLQPWLASRYQVVTIDRQGNGFSTDTTEPSYRRFSDDLAQLLPQLTDKPVILVSFASASISTVLFYQKYQKQFQIKGMLWLDPDVPTETALALYRAYPVDWYQANLVELLPRLAAGVWNNRTADKLQAERQQVQQLITADAGSMDWPYFDAISALRLTPQRQQQRALEIANYAADLTAYAKASFHFDIPVSIIDSDFESQQQHSDSKVAAQLQQWQLEGSRWSRQISRNSGGQYIHLPQADHLLMLHQPQKIAAAIDWLATQAKP
jgi:polyhydroxybutyrate depolymerase